MTLKEFTIQAISKGSDDVGKVHMQVEYDGDVLWLRSQYRHHCRICGGLYRLYQQVQKMKLN